MLKLSAGAGPGTTKQEGVIRIDIIPEWCDVVCNIFKEKIPFDDNLFDEIEASHILEHCQLNEDFIHTMREFLRVLKPGGTLYIEVPHKDSDAAYESIEHSRYFTENSFVNFYSNPYWKEMKYPLFRCLDVHCGERGGHKTVCVLLTKD